MHHPSLLFSLSIVLGPLGLDVFENRKLIAETFFRQFCSNLDLCDRRRGRKMSALELSGARPLTPPFEYDAQLAGASTGGCPAATMTPITINNNPLPSPPSPPSSIKGRRNRSSLQREANRSKQFTSRLQRSATTTENTNDSDLLGRRPGRSFRRQTTSLPVDHGLKAIEPPHEQALTKMAFAEQQKWITVQQKTFTKWYASRIGLPEMY